MDEPINIPPEESFLTDEEKQIFGNPQNAKFRLFREGHFYPVGRMFDALGKITMNPLHAFGCIAFADKWGMIQCQPGEIEPVREGRPWIV